MSGVAKDDINPNSPADATIPVAGEHDAGKPVSPDAIVSTAQTPPSTKDAAIKDEAEPRSRRPAPHLRVVTDADLALGRRRVRRHQRGGRGPWTGQQQGGHQATVQVGGHGAQAVGAMEAV